MRYLSVCSGMEAASVAWSDLGWKAVGFSEIEPFPCEILKQRFPNVKNYGDLEKYREWDIEPGTVDVLVGGTPCQSFSLSGLKKGMDDPRGNLALIFLGLAERIKPRWIIWENVFGVLSANGGRDFGTFLAALGNIGYGWSYRLLDAQYVGRCEMHAQDGEGPVPQRRKRIYLVAHLGDWRPTTAVLFESESIGRMAIADGKEKQETPATSGTCVEKDNFPFGTAANPEIANTVQTTSNDYSRADSFNTVVTRRRHSIVRTCDTRLLGKVEERDVCPTIKANSKSGDNEPLAFDSEELTVRRLTPNETLRLQGFPDNWTRIPWRGKSADDCPDSPQYKAIGNSMATNVIRWVGKRIQEFEDHAKV
jgi:DNA (cytosine-5)-methyltransferase 1